MKGDNEFWSETATCGAPSYKQKQSLECTNFEIGNFLYMKYVTYPLILAVAACPVEPTKSVGFMIGQLLGWESR